MNLAYTDEELTTTIHHCNSDNKSADSSDLELNQVLDHMNEQQNIEFEEQQNDNINFDPWIKINNISEEIPNDLVNLIWKTQDLCKELTPLSNMFQGNGTLNLGIFLEHVQFAVEWHSDISRNWHYIAFTMQCPTLIVKAFLVMVLGIIKFLKLRL